MDISDVFQRDSLIEPNFIGRAYELDWLRNHYFKGMGRHEALVVNGAPGVGKTALIQYFLYSSRISAEPLWLDVNARGAPEERIDQFIARLYDKRPRGDFLVVIDGAESLSDEKLDYVVSKVFNIKATRGLIFVTRSNPSLKRASRLTLERLSASDALALINRRFNGEVPSDALGLLVAQAQGNPVALNVLIQLLQGGDLNSVQKILSGNIYDLSSGFKIPEPEIITSLKPQIISANDYLIEKLRKQPDSIYDLEPRKFEELLAELLTDMGWDVELTKATRDGGKDMLAYLDTELGRILCLVEAKRYRQDRTVGVDLVRNLYGTLCDYQANSAMLITTSSFSQDAVNFQKRHEYQLQLRDYGDLLFWIQNYKNRAGVI